MTQPISILLCALGGEGGGVLADWLVDAARHGGLAAQATSIPGVAQRTGATTYYLEIFPTPISELGGRRPVFGLNPLPGRLDLLVSSELLETARQISLGLCSPDRTLLISASNRALTTHEKMQMGDGRMDDAVLLQLLQQHSHASHVLDMVALTRQAGTVVSAVMLGCIAASKLLPLRREDFEFAVHEGQAKERQSASQQASLRGFALAWDAMQAQSTQSKFVDAVLTNTLTIPNVTSEQIAKLSPELAATFPSDMHEMLGLGVARLMDYQGDRYVSLYIQRLREVLASEQRNGTDGACTVTKETARWLALWMAFDDIVRVADLKSRASRWQRVRMEVKAKTDDVLKVYDHFKPGVPEFAALLPKVFALPLLRWDRQRSASGLSPLALPIKVGTHSVIGMVMLRVLASFKWLRVLGNRYAEEQAMIDAWLKALVRGAQEDVNLGLALAQCGQLIKGYGTTNERGRDNLLHILRHLAPHDVSVDSSARNAETSRDSQAHLQKRINAINDARNAALRDAGGIALDQALRAHGAPIREVKAQPIRWMARSKAQ
jgi:indolepyruvate ferredoxin oxidoreductase, beta subunit